MKTENEIKKERLEMNLKYIIDYAECIKQEAEQYQKEPEYFFTHGYANEKITKLLKEFEDGKKTLKGGV